MNTRNLIRIIMIAIMMLAATDMSAAPKQKNAKTAPREQFIRQQARSIARQLSLSPDDSTKFVTVFTKCQKELLAVNTSRPLNMRKLTEAQTDSVLRARFDQSQKTLNIRKKYYNEYRKFLTAKQVNRVYSLDSRIMKRLKTHRNTNKKHPGQKQSNRQRNQK